MKECKIIFTSDTHGHVLPVNYATGQAAAGGLLAMAARAPRDGNTLVLDGGDALQGTPLVQYYLEHRDAYAEHPVAAGFTAMGLTAYTLGNHDFNFGYEALLDYTSRMPAQLVCANVEDLRGALPLKKWTVCTLANGLKVGITGAVTDHVNVWEKPENLRGLRVTEPIAAVQAALAKMRAVCDLTICLYHGGYEEDLSTGRLLSDSTENVACRLARCCAFDLLLTGHQHMPVPGVALSGSWSVQPPANAASYAELRAEVAEGADRAAEATVNPSQSRTEETEQEQLAQKRTAAASARAAAGSAAQGRADEPSAQPAWVRGESCRNGRRVTWASRLVPVPCAPVAHLPACRALEPLEAAVERWLDEPIGAFETALPPEDKLTCGLRGSRVAAFFNQVQLESVEADISCVGLGNAPVGFAREVSIRDVYAAYTFANTSVVKEISGAALKEALERCACFLDLDESGQPYIGKTFLMPKVEIYNYDFYAGLDVAFDLRKPHGARVVRLCRLNGQPIAPEETLRLVTSDYRATGTGGYDMIGRCKTVFTGADNVQDLIVDYIRTHHPVRVPQNYRFEVRY